MALALQVHCLLHTPLSWGDSSPGMECSLAGIYGSDIPNILGSPLKSRLYFPSFAQWLLTAFSPLWGPSGKDSPAPAWPQQLPQAIEDELKNPFTLTFFMPLKPAPRG